MAVTGGVKATAAAACIVVVAVAVGCSPFGDRRQAADKLSDAMRAVPGVVHVGQTYTNDIDNGASYELNVEVGCSVSAPALAAAARAFVDGVDAAGFPGHVVELRVQMHLGRYTYVPPGEPDYSQSAADFRLSDDRRRFDVSSPDVAADVSLWVDVLRFPGVMALKISRPPGQQSGDGQHSILWAAVVDRDAGIAVQQWFPQLQTRWRIPPPERIQPGCTPPLAPRRR